MFTQEFLLTNSPLEMAAPLKEFAARDKHLGGSFHQDGQIAVDKCCDFRGAITLALPHVSTYLDLKHWIERLADKIPAGAPLKTSFLAAVHRAVVAKAADSKAGTLTVFHAKEIQAENLSKIKQTHKTTDIWTLPLASCFDTQAIHASKGCLAPRHAHLPCHTSINENWHRRINALTKGHASSLTTVIDLVKDYTHRANLTLALDESRSQPLDSPSRKFRAATRGSPHVFLVDETLRLKALWTKKDQPRLLRIFPEHQFGFTDRGSE